MSFNKAEWKGCKAVFVLISFILSAGTAAYCAESSAKKDPTEWNKVVEAAKKEGKIVMCGDPSEEWRKSLADLFREEYPEITIEYTGMYVRDFWPRLRQERQLGKKLWDVVGAGVDALSYAAKKEGFLIPIRPLLVRENADDSKWIGGLDSLFYDKEKKFMPAYTVYLFRTSFVNRDFVKESELKLSEQLLDPKFKGQIVMQTPNSGNSLAALSNLGFMYGENFVRDFLKKQEAVITDDKRQQSEWLVRGKYPIAIGFSATQLVPFEKQGLGKNIIPLADKITVAGTGPGGIFIIKDAPHPNAAIVYVNWLLSQKTQLKLMKNVQLNSLRTDVPPVVKELAVDPANLNKYRRYSTEENTEYNGRFLPIINDFLKK